ncbi:MAG: hypothetical protein P8X58_14025, partial [Syntrophobacterales bacterium]
NFAANREEINWRGKEILFLKAAGGGIVKAKINRGNFICQINSLPKINRNMPVTRTKNEKRTRK